MSVYFVNASGSATAPYDTVAKGAVNITTLTSGISLGSGDFVEFTDDGVIDDTGAEITLSDLSNVTFRSYSGNINKPTINVYAEGDVESFAISLSNCADITFGSLKFIKDLDGGDQNTSWGGIIVAYEGGSSNLIVSGCEFLVTNFLNWGFEAAIICYEQLQKLTVDKCKFEGFGWAAIDTTNSLGSKITNNLIKGCGAGIRVNPADDTGITVSNNTIYDIHVWDQATDCKYGIAQQGSGPINIVNNIIQSASGDDAAYAYGIYLGSDFLTVISDYNDVYDITTPYYGPRTPGAHDLNVDPLFVDASGGNFQLQASSPCINSGVGSDVYSDVPNDDYDGVTRPQDITWDIGAFEYETVVPPTPAVPTVRHRSAVRTVKEPQYAMEECRQTAKYSNTNSSDYGLTQYNRLVKVVHIQLKQRKPK